MDERRRTLLKTAGIALLPVAAGCAGRGDGGDAGSGGDGRGSVPGTGGTTTSAARPETPTGTRTDADPATSTRTDPDATVETNGPTGTRTDAGTDTPTGTRPDARTDTPTGTRTTSGTDTPTETRTTSGTTTSPDPGTPTATETTVASDPVELVVDNVGVRAWEVTEDGSGSVAPTDEENPTLALDVGRRYTVENRGWPAHPFALRTADDSPLLSQASDGRFEDAGGVDWTDDGGTFAFTLTEDLAAAVDHYVCTVHAGMRGDVETG